MAKFKHANGEMDINKKILSTYSDEQLAQFGVDNGLEPDDVVKLRERIGAPDEVVEEAPKAKSKKSK